jgi:hypothetical protein
MTMPRVHPCLLAFVLLAPAVPVQTVLYVDPVLGVDQAGGGGPANPLKTVTFAVTQAVGHTTFRLRPGKYGRPSGEVFPIVLPDFCVVEGDPARVPRGSGLAAFETSLEIGQVFRILPGVVSDVVLRDFETGGGMFLAVRLDVQQPGSTASLRIERMAITYSRCVTVNVTGGSQAAVWIEDSTISGPDTPITIATVGESTCGLALDRCHVRGGLGSAVHLNATAGGQIVALLRNVDLGPSNQRGVLAATDNGGAVSTRIEHCRLREIARGVIGTSRTIGALGESAIGTGQTPIWVIVNSLFEDNRNDAVLGVNPNYAWGVNLVTQANLIGIGKNRGGAATHAAPDDFHLTAQSLGVDLGDPLAVSDPRDLDGDPRTGLPDLGPDEYQPLYVESVTTAAPGRLYRPRVLTDAPASFALVIGGSTNGTFGPGQVHLGGAFFFSGLAGTTDARGVGEAPFTIPADPTLVGRAVYWQAVSTVAPVLGSNAWRTIVRG